jgi:hypothetical protein
MAGRQATAWTPQVLSLSKWLYLANLLFACRVCSTMLACPAGTHWPLQPTTVSLPPKHKALLTLLPPCQNVADPLVIVDIARTAEVPIQLRHSVTAL